MCTQRLLTFHRQLQSGSRFHLAPNEVDTAIRRRKMSEMVKRQIQHSSVIGIGRADLPSLGAWDNFTGDMHGFGAQTERSRPVYIYYIYTYICIYIILSDPTLPLRITLSTPVFRLHSTKGLWRPSNSFFVLVKQALDLLTSRQPIPPTGKNPPRKQRQRNSTSNPLY